MGGEGIKLIDEQFILDSPIIETDCTIFCEANVPYAIDENGTRWVCGFYHGQFGRVKTSQITPGSEMQNSTSGGES